MGQLSILREGVTPLRIHKALPGLNLVNKGVTGLRVAIENGERGCSPKKVGAYLGYRLVSYSLLSAAVNLISTLVSGVLFILTFPTRFCTAKLNDWCFNRFDGSLYYLKQNITTDLFYDFSKCCGRNPQEV